MALRSKFRIANAITRGLTRIERARGFLDAAKLSEEWIAGMQQRALILEAHYTTHIEGTHLTLDQSERMLAGEKPAGVKADDAKEVVNYRKAFDLVAGYVGSGDPISEGLIREIHKRLVRGVRGNSAAPGEYRTIQNYVANSVTKEIIYTPPRPPDVGAMRSEFVTWLNAEHDVHPILVAGIAQFQLVHIHPFLDGNGRTARLLSMLCLYRRGYDFKRLFTLSEYYDRGRSGYYRAIQSVRQAMRIVDAKRSKYFGAALANFERARDCYRRAGPVPEWERTVQRVCAAHLRKKAFIAGFRALAAGASHRKQPSFLDRAKARWDERHGRGGS